MTIPLWVSELLFVMIIRQIYIGWFMIPVRGILRESISHSRDYEVNETEPDEVGEYRNPISE